MNTKLLRKIARVIQAKPRQFDMRSFTGYSLKCGTTHCIGGWAESITGEDACIALGISREQGDRLFYVNGGSGWPARFRGRKKKTRPNDYEWFPTPRQAAARIEWFIETEGRE